MKTNRHFCLISFTIIILFSNIHSQNFNVTPLVGIPGNNYKYDILSPEMGMPNSETYICWVNTIDSLYNIYLKQISPIIGNNILVASDYSKKSNPLIAINRFSKGLKIVWQCYENNLWKVYLRNYNNNQLSEPVILLDSIMTDPQISLSTHRLVWVTNNNLYIKDFYSSNTEDIIIDTENCSSPDLIKYDFIDQTKLLYIKNNNDSLKVNLINYNKQRVPQLEKICISDGLVNSKPRFGINGEITFQTFENNFWKSVYCETSNSNMLKTKNEYCNYYNPILFTYPIPTLTVNNNKTPFFLVFDTDSITDNNEIFIKSFYYDLYDSLINISQCEGNDYNPRVAYTSNTDSVFVSVIWEHYDSGKNDIWIANHIFSPILSSKDYDISNNFYYSLAQNYPNPFNPSTTISFSIPNTNEVQLTVYDILGKEVVKLVNEYKDKGNYKVEFSGENLSSGIYFYQLVSGKCIKTKKLILLK